MNEQKKDLKRAEQVMTALFNIKENERRLTSSISEELKVYKEIAKLAEEELLEIAERNPQAFDADGNLVLEDGYVHTATNTVVDKNSKFDLAVFAEKRPDLIDVKLKVSPIKKLWLDKEAGIELRKLGITVDTAKELQVITRKVIS
jgi:hypothetical protein